LKPGGRFLCLEFSKISNNPILAALYDGYSFNVIPKLGQVVANDHQSYQYLVESIRKFPGQKEFGDLICKAGFSHVTYENMSQGIVAIHSGFKM
jgi:ubiquinone/menaquinone biosynthesis C-methylase UbiE